MSIWSGNNASFSEMKGKHIAQITGLSVGSESVTFEFTDGSEYRLYHEPECCENVDLNEIVGDVEDLKGLLMEAEEVSSEGVGPPKRDWQLDSFTWTFYKLRTSKGCVVLRWLGESNGYYSETAVFERVRAADVKEAS